MGSQKPKNVPNNIFFQKLLICCVFFSTTQVESYPKLDSAGEDRPSKKRARDRDSPSHPQPAPRDISELAAINRERERARYRDGGRGGHSPTDMNSRVGRRGSSVERDRSSRYARLYDVYDVCSINF